MNLSITLFLIRIMLITILIFSACDLSHCTATTEFLFSIFVPIMIYPNAETNKTNILLDNKSKAGIYQWKHNKSGKLYIGSAIDLAKRLKRYYFPSELKRVDNYICRALLLHGHSEFSLTIFENVDISNKSKDEAKTLVLEREQHYLDVLLPKYNILKKAGNSYGYKHTPEVLAKFSGENHPMFGKSHSAETLNKMSEALSGENNPRGMKGKAHTADSLAKMSNAKSGENHPKGMLGKAHSAETKEKISKGSGTAIYVYSKDKATLVNSFPSANKAGKYFDCCNKTIKTYALSGLLFKEEWILSTCLITLTEDCSPES